MLVVHNLGDGAVTAGPYAVDGRAFRPLFTDPGAETSTAGKSGVAVRLPAHASGVWAIER